jgi:Ca-activated chloride channel family protein
MTRTVVLTGYPRLRMRRCRLAAGALWVLALLLAPALARAQGQPAPDKDAAVILVVDASKSMKADDGSGRPKIAAAKAALNTLVDDLPDDAKVGLRVYGSEVSGTGKAAGCADTKLVSPVAPLDRAGLKASIDAITPRGFTPIGASLQGAAKDLGTAKQKTVVLVSDGGDNCAPPAPCGVARELSKGGVALKIQAVGFQVASSARKQLQCIADAGGGRYVDADNAKDLGSQLRSLTARALRPYVTVGSALQGVPAPAQAKLYGPGQYTTQVSPNSPSWYAFKVGAGQSIAISATLPDSDAGIPSVFKTELQDESLEFSDSDAATNSDDVLTAIVKADVGEDDLREPPNGRFFYKLEVDPTPGQSSPFPIELFVRVRGKVIGAPAAPSGSSGAVDTSTSAGDDGPSDVVLAAGGLGAIVAGLLAGGALAGMRRRRPA